MDYPNIRTTINDDATGITWNVITYRTLSQAEMMAKIRDYLVQRNGNRPKCGTSIVIVSLVPDEVHEGSTVRAALSTASS